MPRKSAQLSRRVYLFPEDFSARLKLLKEKSGLTWAEIARRLGVNPRTVLRWWKYGVRPGVRHQMALLKLAEDLDLGHILTTPNIQDAMSGSNGSGHSLDRVVIVGGGLPTWSDGGNFG